MDTEGSELFVGVSADSWQLDPPFSCCEIPSGHEWALDPERVSALLLRSPLLPLQVR